MRYTPGKGRPAVVQEPSAGGGSSSSSSSSGSSIASADGNTYAHVLGRVTTVLHFVHEQV
jgi:preprotein translocase subunit SecG